MVFLQISRSLAQCQSQLTMDWGGVQGRNVDEEVVAMAVVVGLEVGCGLSEASGCTIDVTSE